MHLCCFIVLKIDGQITGVNKFVQEPLTFHDRFIFSCFSFNNTISIFFGLFTSRFKIFLSDLKHSSSNLWSKLENSFSMFFALFSLIMGTNAKSIFCCLEPSLISLLYTYTQQKIKYIQVCKRKRHIIYNKLSENTQVKQDYDKIQVLTRRPDTNG